MYDIMTPGPTQVRENVRQARALACTNPDLDADFYDFYKGDFVCHFYFRPFKLGRFIWKTELWCRRWPPLGTRAVQAPAWWRTAWCSITGKLRRASRG